MIFRNYCAIFFNPTEGVEKEVAKISEGKPRKIGGTGITIFTFSSVVDVTVLTDFFKSFNRNFLLFDLDKSSSGFNLLDKGKEEQLFGFLNNSNIISDYEILSNKLMDDIIEHSKNNSTINTDKIIDDMTLRFNLNKKEKSFEIDDDFNNVYENMTKSEINNEVNKIIDKGVDNLTDNDKKRLKKLSSLI